MRLTVSGDISLVELAALKFGNLNALFEMAMLNGCTIDAIPAAGEIDLPELVFEKSITNDQKVSVLGTNQLVSAKEGQVLLDLALQEGGSLEALFDIAQSNGLSITDDLLIHGNYFKPSVIDEKIVRSLSAQKIASGFNLLGSDLATQNEGIDYWIIENNFIVN